jgi:acyl-CoA thioesterase I
LQRFQATGAKFARPNGSPLRGCSAIANSLSRALLLTVAAFMCGSMTAHAASLRIVAIGASNTHGWYVGNHGAYPAQLQDLLRVKGIDAEVTNAGVPFDTTAMMLRRIDTDVPNGTDIAILQPGGNDLRFFGTKQQRAANIAEMERRLNARSIKVIVYDEEIPLRYYTIDFIHLTREGHAMIAAALLPRIIAIIDRQRSDALPRGNASTAGMRPIGDRHGFQNHSRSN